MAMLRNRDGRHFLQPPANRSSHRERFDAVRDLVTDRSVLDLGAGSGYHREDWMHQQLRSVATEVVGVELSAELVALAAQRGVHLVHGDAGTVQLGRKFDVVFAGELIEHLSCFSQLLDNAARHLAEGGRIVLTTPNAFCVSNFVYRMGGRPSVHPEHTCWFCEVTLGQLLERHGFDVERVQYLRHRTPGTFRRLAAGLVRACLPERLACNTFMIVGALRTPSA